jgi:putative membrane protein
MKNSPVPNLPADINLQDYLALERTKLANERTFFSFLRTSLYMLLGGIAFLQLQGYDEMKWMGFVTISLSVIIFVIGIYRYIKLGKKLKRYYKHQPTK